MNWLKWLLIVAAVAGLAAGLGGGSMPDSAAARICLLLAIAIGVVWHYRGFRPSHQYLRDRSVDRGYWPRIYPSEQLPLALEGLATIRSAFLLRADDIDRLHSEDRLADIYGAAYPSKWAGDALEFETLWRDLNDRFHVPETELTGLVDFTVGQTIDACIAHRDSA